MNRIWICLSLFCCGVLAACPGAFGVEIPIVNSGFEFPVVADGDWPYMMDNEGWGYYANDGYLGVWNPGGGDYGDLAPEGENVGWTEPGDGVPGGFGQVLTTPLTAGTTYTLTVEVGNTPGYLWGGYSVQLLAGGIPQAVGTGADYTGEVTGGILLAEDNNTLTIAENTFETSTVSYSFDWEQHSDYLGEPLQIRLLCLGGEEVDFDAVSLNAETDPMLYWDALGNGNWGDLRWRDEGDNPVDWFPDVGAPAWAIIDANTVTVAQDRQATRLIVGGGAVAVDDYTLLNVEQDAAFADDTQLTLGVGSSMSTGGGLTADAVTIGSGVSLTAGGGGTIASIAADGSATIGTGSDLTVDTYTNNSGGTFTKQGAGKLLLNNTTGNAVTLGDAIVVEEGTLTLKGGGQNWKAGASQFELAGGTLAVSHSVSDLDVQGTPDTLTEWYFKGTFDLDPLDFDLFDTLPVWGLGEGEGVLDRAIDFPFTDIGPDELLGTEDDVTYDFNSRSGGRTGYDDFGALWFGFINVGETSRLMGIDDIIDEDLIPDYSFGTTSDDDSVIWIDQDQNGTFERNNANGIDELVVNNTSGVQVGSIDLEDGSYRVAIGFFETTGAESMEARFAPGLVTDYYQMIGFSDPVMLADNNIDPTDPGQATYTPDPPDPLDPPKIGIWTGAAPTVAMPDLTGTTLTVTAPGSAIQVLHNTVWNHVNASGTVNVTPGWVDFEVRFNGGDGGTGKVGDMGFGFDPTGAATSTVTADYILPRNSDADTADLFRAVGYGLIDMTSTYLTVTADSRIRCWGKMITLGSTFRAGPKWAATDPAYGTLQLLTSTRWSHPRAKMCCIPRTPPQAWPTVWRRF